MKKIVKILSSTFVLLCGVLVLVSCNSHKHVVKEDSWVRDANSHWHACDGCDELFDYDLHAYGDYTKDSKECKQSRTCTICGYVQTTTVAHTFADWGSREDGSFGKECTHCHHVEYLAQYYVRGSFDAGWAALDDYKLVINATTMSATVTVTLEKGTKFKVATGDWGKEFNGGTIIAAEGLFAGTGDIEVLTTGEYTFVVTGLDGEAKCTATFKAVVNEPTVEEPTTGDEPTADAPVTGGEETQEPVQTYTISYNVNGVGEAPASVSDATKLPDTLPELDVEGYEFIGWYTDENCTTAAVAGAAISANTTLYAKWVKTTYSVTYDVNEVGEAPAKVEGVKALPAELPILNADGYEFEGWYTDEALTTKAVAGAAISANTTLYAKWREVVAVEGLLAVVGNSSVEFKKTSSYIDGVNTSYLNVLIYLAVNDVVTIKNADASYGFDFDDVTFAEGLFTDAEGSLKATKAGYYSIRVFDFNDTVLANCDVLLSYAELSLAELAAAPANTGYFITGTVKSEDADTIVLTDGEATPTEISVILLGNFLPGDVIQVRGTKTVKNDVASYGKATFINRVSTVAVESDVLLTKVTSLEQLVDGAKVIIAADKYVMGEQSGDLREVVYSPNYKDSRAQVVTLVKNGETWKLQVGTDQYLVYNGTKNKINTGAYVESNGDWKIEIVEGSLKVVSVKDDKFNIQWNNGATSHRFACYAATQNDVDLYLVETIAEKVTFLPLEEEVSDSIALGTRWNYTFILGEEGYGKTWKITANGKKVLDVDGKTVDSSYRLQSQGKNKMFIDLADSEDCKVIFQFFVLSGSGTDLTRTITLKDAEDQELDVFTISQNDGWADKTVLNTMVFEFTIDGGQIYELLFSNGINIHGVNAFVIEK